MEKILKDTQLSISLLEQRFNQIDCPVRIFEANVKVYTKFSVEHSKSLTTFSNLIKTQQQTRVLKLAYPPEVGVAVNEKIFTEHRTSIDAEFFP